MKNQKRKIPRKEIDFLFGMDIISAPYFIKLPFFIMKTSHERLSMPAENLNIPETDGVQQVRDFRYRLTLASPKDSTDNGTKPANKLNQQEVEKVRKILKKNRGVRHQTADELDCSISWLDEVISTHKLEK
jgi:hypothetical protein